jgi:DNA-binding transcriptional LysR family regulator
VQAGSFTAAARTLSLPKSTVSRKVADLEERLGARLLQRTTRKLHLTDVGRAYYDHGARIVAEAEEAELEVSQMQCSALRPAASHDAADLQAG